MSVTDFSDLMPNEVQFESFQGEDDYNKPFYASPVTYRCRVSWKTSLVRTADGKNEASRGYVWLMTEDTISSLDRMTLPSGESPPILTIESPYDETGTRHHTKVTFK